MSDFYRFHPADLAPSPERLVVMPSILGGNIWDKANRHRVSDLGQRAQILADESGLTVLALQRLSSDDLRTRQHFLGLPRAYDPSEYTQVIAQEARVIENVARQLCTPEITLVGVSSGAERGLAHVEAGLTYRSMFLYDPAAVRRLAWPVAFSRWLAYQAKVGLQDVIRRPDFPNEHRLGYDAQGEVTGLEDLVLHRKIWSSNASYCTLAELALGLKPNMKDSTTRVLLPNRSFTMTPTYRAIATDMMNWAASSTGVDFAAEIVDMPHRAPDDPYRLSNLVFATGVLSRPEQN